MAAMLMSQRCASRWAVAMVKYKYVSPGRINDLLDGKIRFTQPGAFNDPFEIPAYKLIRAKTLAGSVTEAGMEIMRAAAAIGNLTGVSAAMTTVGGGQLGLLPSSLSETSLPLGTSVAVAQRQRPRPPMAWELCAPRRLPANVATDSEAAIKLIDETYGILSLTAVKDNLLMWAHYSAAHTGAVICIDIEDTNFAKCGNVFQEDVEYRDDDALPELPQNLQDVRVKEHFFIKSKEWKYEKEYRIVRYLNNGKKEPRRSGELYDLYLFDLPPSCIHGLIFGVRCEEGTKEKITTKVSESPQLEHIKLEQARLCLSHFKLTFEDWSLEKQKQWKELKQKQAAEEKQKESNQHILEETMRQQFESRQQRILEELRGSDRGIKDRISKDTQELKRT